MNNLVKNNRLYLIAIAAIIVIIVASVGVVLYYQGQNNTTPTPSPTLTPSTLSTPSPSALSITVTDDTGHTVTLTEYPKRIVSLAPGNTQILFAVGAGDNVVGVTDYCNYPYNFSAWIEAGNMTSIGSYYGPAIEPIVALNPDLVVAARGSEDAADQLRSLGYNVLTLDPDGLDQCFPEYNFGWQSNRSRKPSYNLSSFSSTKSRCGSQRRCSIHNKTKSLR